MHLLHSPTVRLVCLAALFALPSCNRQKALRAELETARTELAGNRERLRSVEEEIRVLESAHPGGGKADRIANAEQELRSVSADLQFLRARAGTAEEKHQKFVDELAAYQKQLMKL